MRMTMTKTLLISILGTALLVQGAPRVDPVQYAREVKEILDERAKRVIEKIKEQNKRYLETAEILAEAERDQLQAAGLVQSQQGARELQIDYSTGHRSPLNWRRDLQPHIREMQDRLFTALLAEIENDRRYLSSFEGLQADLERTETIAKLVETLATKRDLKDELLRWHEYGSGAKDQFQKLACTNTKAGIASRQETIKGAKAELASLQGAQAEAARIVAKQAEIKRLEDEVKAMDAWTKAKNCK